MKGETNMTGNMKFICTTCKKQFKPTIINGKPYMVNGIHFATNMTEQLRAWILAILTNDEASTNDELEAHFIKEGGLSRRTARAWVAKRMQYLGRI